MDYLLLGICSVIIIIFFLGYREYYGRKYGKKVIKRTKNSDEPGNVKCPVCGCILFKGENLISKVYRPMNVPDQYMTVSGCPHCYPIPERGVKRICPVCHKSMGQNDYLTARLFNKTDSKKHVHIAGCSNCHKAKFD